MMDHQVGSLISNGLGSKILTKFKKKKYREKKTCKHHPRSGKSQAYTDLKRNMRNKEIFIQESHNIKEGFFLIKKMWPKYSETRWKGKNVNSDFYIQLKRYFREKGKIQTFSEKKIG